jgi:hypothetical protein
MISISAAVEEDRPSNRHTLLRQCRTLLQETAEGRHPSARADHDHRSVRVGWRTERDGRFANKGELRAVLHAAREVVGGNPVEVAISASGRAM